MDTRRRRTIRKHTDLEVYQRAFDAAMRIRELSRNFPREERYSLTDPGAAIFPIRLRERRRRLAQAPLRRRVYQQALRQ